MKQILLSAAALALVFSAQPARAEMSAAQKTEIEALVKEYILNNPEVLIQSFENHRIAEEKRVEEESASAAKSLVAELVKNKNTPSAGASEPDVVVVEFMDYNCGYCKKAFEEVQSTLKEDKKVKIYFLDFPILGPTSTEAAKWALAAQKQGKYFEYHTALMLHQGPKEDSVLESKAKEVGMDVDQAKKDKESAEIKQAIDLNMARAQSLNITGTPGFIIGDDVVRGYVTYDQMKEMVAKARKK